MSSAGSEAGARRGSCSAPASAAAPVGVNLTTGRSGFAGCGRSGPACELSADGWASSLGAAAIAAATACSGPSLGAQGRSAAMERSCRAVSSFRKRSFSELNCDRSFAIWTELG